MFTPFVSREIGIFGGGKHALITMVADARVDRLFVALECVIPVKRLAEAEIYEL